MTKILIVNDFASVAFTFQKYFHSEVDVIYMYKHPSLSLTKNPLFFTKDDLLVQVEQIRSLSDRYDVFICLGWLASAICYLAGVKYVMYFVDAYIDPKYRLWKKMSFVKKYFFAKLFENVLKNASCVVGCDPHNTSILKKYRNDIAMIFPMIDPGMFRSDMKKTNLNEGKFVFLSPQRIEEDKGQLLMWKALKITRSDFVVLQTDWGTGEYYKAAIREKPDKVKIIPKIPRDDIASYYVSSNAILGQISKTTCGGVEREAILCKVPVFCYAPISFTGNDPFYRKSTNPEDLAQYIDKIVEDSKFREELVVAQGKWLSDTFDNNVITDKWQEIFDKIEKLDKRRPNKMYYFGLRLFNLLKNK
jgi:glycosyltransferase involved in cell wall biosynthesis